MYVLLNIVSKTMIVMKWLLMGISTLKFSFSSSYISLLCLNHGSPFICFVCNVTRLDILVQNRSLNLTSPIYGTR